LIDRDRLLNHIRDSEDRQTMTKILNKAQKSLKNYIVCATEFYSPYEINMAIPIIDQIHDISYFIYGAYENAERKIMIFYPSIFELTKEDYPIGIIKIEGNFNKSTLSHRDFLGAILGLGLKRGKIGDILIGEKETLVIGYKEINEFIRLNLTKIGRNNISIEPVDLDYKIEIEDKYKMVTSTVASLRLDSVVATGFSISRGIATKLIKGDKVKVNWKLQPQPSTLVCSGDVISVRGKGRIEVFHVGGKTKKGRYKVQIKKMI
jgi:RNA-binding protein YlmH